MRLHAAVTLLDAELKVSLHNEDRLQSFSQTFIATMASLDNILKSSKPVAIPEQRVIVAATASYDDLALFDFKNILALLGNNQALLIDILQTFKDSFHSFLAELNALLLTKDRLAIQTIVHTLKGTAGNMGAMRLHAAVTLLDTELKVSLPNEDRLQSFSQTFVATMASLDNILKS
jgi:HPt (histidine-containing phosphotransfer) domain-containing protein